MWYYYRLKKKKINMSGTAEKAFTNLHRPTQPDKQLTGI